MKIIHCADLHLDSKMDCTLPKNMSIKRNHELCMTFCNMVEFADKNKVQVIMICGDLFDSSSVKFTTLSFVLSLIKKHPNIIFFYLRGNHDEQYNLSQEDLPSNLKLFSSEWQYYRLKDVIFAGIEFNEHNPQSLYSKLRLPYDTTNIVMMHGQIGANSEKNVINLAAFHSAPIDYLALGHSHSYKENSLPLRGKWCYSGCLEGRGFDETGQKGFVLLDIHNHSVHSEFIPFAYRLHHKFDLDISNFISTPEIMEEIQKMTKKIPAKDLIRFNLTGIYYENNQIDFAFLKDFCLDSHYYIDFQDARHYVYTPSSSNNFTLKDAFIQSVQDDIQLTEDEKNGIILLGIKALRGEDITL